MDRFKRRFSVFLLGFLFAGSAYACRLSPALRKGVGNLLLPGRSTVSTAHLDARFAGKVETLIERLEARGYSPHLRSTYRSDKRQSFIYNLSDLGQRLGLSQRATNADAGQSCHNHVDANGKPASLAIDIWGYPFGPDLHLSKTEQQAHATFFVDLGREAARLGLKWGGNYSRKGLWAEHDLGWDPAHVADGRCRWR